ncbi:hypothetical protein [Endozoicomonas sp.]|uniref:hypothetical protein n=1 Tax=Endozoicomonas sp. TaxID=1892382 RepID=UPI00288771FE|nr:hypothetical protein [Endozoicomonas sp.]
MGGRIQGGGNSAAYNIDVQPWIVGEGESRGFSRGVTRVECPSFLPHSDDLKGNVKLLINESGNHLKIRVYTNADDTEPARAEGLRDKLREGLVCMGDTLAVAKGIVNSDKREECIRGIINNCLQNIHCKALESNHVESGDVLF